MNFSEYREAIFKARSIPFKATSAILERQTVALEMAVARLNLLISEATNSIGQVDAVLYRVKRQNTLALQYTEIRNRCVENRYQRLVPDESCRQR